VELNKFRDLKKGRKDYKNRKYAIFSIDNKPDNDKNNPCYEKISES